MTRLPRPYSPRLHRKVEIRQLPPRLPPLRQRVREQAIVMYELDERMSRESRMRQRMSETVEGAVSDQGPCWVHAAANRD